MALKSIKYFILLISSARLLNFIKALLAGAALAVAEELQIPIAFIGVGEGVEDLAPFKLQDFLQALLDVV